jgi:glucokinase
VTLAIGVDLGGTHLRAGALRVEAAGAADAADAADAAPALAASHRELIGADRDPRAIVDRLAVIVDRLAGPGALIANAAPIPVGIGLAAMLRDAHGTVARSPHLGWRDVPFGALLRARLGPRFAVGVYNDVNAVTWGEAVAGAARGCRDVLAVYVGTGIGGGVIANGALVAGASSCAGEIGHAKVRWDDAAALCNCGGRGCVEAYVGGSYLDRRIRREVSEKRTRTSAVQLAGGAEHVTVAHVDQAAADGDAWALALWTELAPLLAVTLGNALAVLNSERLVLGGGLLSRTPTLVSLVDISLRIVGPPPSLEPLTIAMAELGDDAGVVGAARLAAAGVAVAAG